MVLVETVRRSWKRAVGLVELVHHTNWMDGGRVPDMVRQRSRLGELSSCWTELDAN